MMQNQDGIWENEHGAAESRWKREKRHAGQAYLPVSVEHVGPRDDNVDLARPLGDRVLDFLEALLERGLARREAGGN